MKTVQFYYHWTFVANFSQPLSVTTHYTGNTRADQMNAIKGELLACYQGFSADFWKKAIFHVFLVRGGKVHHETIPAARLLRGATMGMLSGDGVRLFERVRELQAAIQD